MQVNCKVCEKPFNKWDTITNTCPNCMIKAKRETPITHLKSSYNTPRTSVKSKVDTKSTRTEKRCKRHNLTYSIDLKKCPQCQLERLQNKAPRVIQEVSKSKAKDMAWKAFAKYIRVRDAIKTTGGIETCRCISCQKVVPFVDIQAGHMIPGRTLPILFDEEIVNGQCYICNLKLNGNYGYYTREMIKIYGADKVEEMYQRKDKVKQYKKHDYLEIIEKYKLLTNDILEKI